MTVGGGGDFQVHSEDLKKAGDNASQIADTMLRQGDDLLAPAKTASAGLPGFALVGALDKCAHAWEDELESVAHAIDAAGERLRTNASNYENADVAGKARFDAAGGAPEQLGD